MSKRPIIYEIIDSLDGHVILSEPDRQEALRYAKMLVVNDPGLENEISFLITRPNGKEFTILFSVTGKALLEFLEAELEE